MIELKATTEFTPAKLEKAAEEATFRNLGHAAASIRKDAAKSIQVAKGASTPGTPPHTHTGLAHQKKGSFGRKNRNAALKRGIAYAVADDDVVIGPTKAAMDRIGQLMEFGGEYLGGDYPARPFMQPALERAVPRLAGEWAGSIGE